MTKTRDDSPVKISWPGGRPCIIIYNDFFSRVCYNESRNMTHDKQKGVVSHGLSLYGFGRRYENRAYTGF